MLTYRDSMHCKVYQTTNETIVILKDATKHLRLSTVPMYKDAPKIRCNLFRRETLTHHGYELMISILLHVEDSICPGQMESSTSKGLRFEMFYMRVTLLHIFLSCKSITFRKIESFSGFDAIIIFVSLILSTMIFMFLMYQKSNPFMSRIREFICFGV